MEFIHKKKAEVQRSKMLSDQAVARRERTKEKRIRREQRIHQKRNDLFGKQADDDDTNVAVQQAIEQQAQTPAAPAQKPQQQAPTKTATKQEKTQPKQSQPTQQKKK